MISIYTWRLERPFPGPCAFPFEPSARFVRRTVLAGFGLCASLLGFPTPVSHLSRAPTQPPRASMSMGDIDEAIDIGPRIEFCPGDAGWPGVAAFAFCSHGKERLRIGCGWPL